MNPTAITTSAWKAWPRFVPPRLNLLISAATPARSKRSPAVACFGAVDKPAITNANGQRVLITSYPKRFFTASKKITAPSATIAYPNIL